MNSMRCTLPAARCHTVSRGTALRATRAPRASTRSAVVVRAAVPPTPMGLPQPKRVPKNLEPRLFGFYDQAEIINSRAAMIGLFALCALEGIANTGLLNMLGVETGNGINIGF